MSKEPQLKKSIFVVGLEKSSMIAFQFVTSIIMARLLSPSDYGLTAMIAIFISLAGILTEAGFGGSLVYHKDVDRKDYSTVFWINLSLSIFLYIIIWLSSGYISNFYGHTILQDIIKLSGLTIIINALGTIQYTMMYKEMKFKSLAKVSIISYIGSAICSISFAVLGFGVWALVAQQVLASVIRTIILIINNRFVPSFYMSSSIIKRHWSYGSGLFYSTILRVIYDNMYLQIIGKYCNIVNAGYYNQAKKLKDIPTNLFSQTFDTALFPIFCKYEKGEELDNKFRKTNRVFSFVVCGLFAYIAVAADEIVKFLLGSKWMGCSWILSIITIGSVFYVNESINRSILKAKGYSKLLFKIDLAKRAFCLIIMFGAVVLYELNGIVWSFVINSIIGWSINVWAVSKHSTYKYKYQSLDLFKYLALSAVSGIIIVFLKGMFLNMLPIISIIISLPVYAIIYIIILKTLGDKSLQICENMIIKKISKQK